MDKEMTKSMRNAFGEKLALMAMNDEKIVALDGDLGNSTRLSYVEDKKPAAFLQMGIAEQNMVSVAAGLATTGMKPWACSFAAFMTRRAYDQIVVQVDQPALPVKLVGSYAGILTSNTGKSHHSLEDIAMMQTLPNMTVIAPGDAREVVRAMEKIDTYEAPVYLRLSRDETLSFLPHSDEEFVIGKGHIIEYGKKIALLSTGSMTSRLYKIMDEWKERGIEPTFVHFPTVKPLDYSLIAKLAKEHSQLVTVEEHFVSSGFGAAVAAWTSEHYPVCVKKIGIENTYSQCGKDQDLLSYHCLTPNQLLERIISIYEHCKE